MLKDLPRAHTPDGTDWDELSPYSTPRHFVGRRRAKYQITCGSGYYIIVFEKFTFFIYIWSRMVGISWKERKTNEKITSLFALLINTKVLRKNELVRMMVEWKIEGRTRRGRPRMTCSEQWEKWIGVSSYKKIKKLAMTREEWRLLHQQSLAFKLDDDDVPTAPCQATHWLIDILFRSTGGEEIPSRTIYLGLNIT